MQLPAPIRPSKFKLQPILSGVGKHEMWNSQVDWVGRSA
jgi:hypothetical protein